jgi:hypothetical protein
MTFFSDEARFNTITTKNNRYWISQNPPLTHEVPLRPVKVGIWCAIIATRIVVPEFLKKQLITNDTYVKKDSILISSCEL